MTDKKKKPLNSVALLFFMIVLAAILTYVIPAGTYQRVIVNGRPVVDPQSFHYIESSPANLLDVFLAIPRGMSSGMGLVIAALLIGGGLACVEASNALNIAISRVIKKVGLHRGNFILVMLFYLFALMGGFMGFIEGSIPFIPIAISIAIGLGYDSIVGVAIAVVGAISGFTCGPANPFTVAVAQSIAGLGIYSGLGLRIVMLLVIPAVCLLYVLRYAHMVRKDPSKSLNSGIDVSDLAFNAEDFKALPFTARHAVVLITLIAGIALYVYGAVNFRWGLEHLGAIFIITGIVAGVVSGLGINGTVETFLRGASSMTGAAFIMGTAYGISCVLNNAKIIDTIVFFLSKPLANLPLTVCAVGILIVIAIINLFIPSGSGKALIVMPIVFPIAQIVGIEAQTAILAYQFGDGITNLCTPLLGVLLLALGLGRVPFFKWERFILPLAAIMFVFGAAFMVIAIHIGYR